MACQILGWTCSTAVELLFLVLYDTGAEKLRGRFNLRPLNVIRLTPSNGVSALAYFRSHTTNLTISNLTAAR